jgi:hypothetical protein
MITNQIITVKSKQDLLGLNNIPSDQIAFVTNSSSFYHLIDWSRRNKSDGWKLITTSSAPTAIVSTSSTLDDSDYVKYQSDYLSDPTAAPTQTIYGNVHIVGNITASGEISAYTDIPYTTFWDDKPHATTTTVGGIIVGSGLTITDGILSATGGGSFDTSLDYSLSGLWTFTITPRVGALNVSLVGHTHAYEPSITKATGYLKWTGSAWSFVNETYSLSSHTHSYLSTANFTIEEVSGRLIIRYGSTIIASISSAGYLKAKDEIEAFVSTP